MSADYSQIELVVLAHLSDDVMLKNAFVEGRDIHTQTASLLFGMEEDQVTPEMRRIGKTINFGVVYGMSGFRLSRDMKIPRKEADNFIETYFERYSGVNRFINETIEKAEELEYVETIKGRRRYLSGINSRNRTEKKQAERYAVNTPIQGSAAEIMKVAMIRVADKLKLEKAKSRLILQVHDELILEVSDSELTHISELVRTTMEKAAELTVPLTVNLEQGKSWGSIH